MDDRMRVYSIAVVKNEVDVIAASLRAALAWSEAIFVLDNGSTDGTWEVVQELMREHPAIVPWKRWDTPFHEGLRGCVYNAFRHVAEPGDWWCMRLDGDEFYVGDPRAVLARVPRCHHVVCKDSIEYRLTQEDVDQYEFKGRFEEDRDKIRYYLPLTWREIRFFRHRPGLLWADHSPFPKHIGIVARELVPVRHYKFRSPKQMAHRVDDRKRVIEELVREHGAAHAGMPQWGTAPVEAANDHGRFYRRSELLFDDGTLPVPTRGGMNEYRNKWYVRSMKYVFHGLRIHP